MHKDCGSYRRRLPVVLFSHLHSSHSFTGCRKSNALPRFVNACSSKFQWRVDVCLPLAGWNERDFTPYRQRQANNDFICKRPVLAAFP